MRKYDWNKEVKFDWKTALYVIGITLFILS